MQSIVKSKNLARDFFIAARMLWLLLVIFLSELIYWLFFNVGRLLAKGCGRCRHDAEQCRAKWESSLAQLSD